MRLPVAIKKGGNNKVHYYNNQKGNKTRLKVDHYVIIITDEPP